MRIKTLGGFMLVVVATVIAGCQGHEVEGDKVYYVSWNEGSGTRKTLIKGADVETFRELDHSKYAIDKNSVYYEARKLADADPKTFVSLLDYYGKDKQYAYLGASRVEGANGSAFEVLDGGPYSRDDTDYFFDTIALHVTDLKSFRILNEVDEYGRWAKDKTHYYLLSRKFPLADYESLTILGEGYAKDKLKAYFRGEVVEGADPHTFKVIGYGYAQDKHAKYDGHKKLSIKDPGSYQVLWDGYTKDKFYVYRGDSIVAGADPATFVFLRGEWAKDKFSYYYHGKPMPMVDDKTFVTLQNSYAKDKNRVYYYGYIVEGADPATFEVNAYTFAGKDKYGCYWNGEKADCNREHNE